MLMQKPFALTQGGADTAVETALQTTIQPGITLAGWLLRAVEFTLKPSILKLWAASDADFTLQMTKRSLTGAIARIETFTDQDLLLSLNQAVIAAGTPANISIRDATYYVNLPDGIIIYAEALYLQLISAGTGQANSVWGRLLYEPVSLTQAEAFAIVASRP